MRGKATRNRRRDGEKEWVSEGLRESGAVSDEEPLSLAGRIRNTDVEEQAGSSSVIPPSHPIMFCNLILSVSVKARRCHTAKADHLDVAAHVCRSRVFGGFKGLEAEPGKINKQTNKPASLQQVDDCLKKQNKDHL